MASSWIWQQPHWPQFRWRGSDLEPLLEQARAARQDLLRRLATLEAPLDLEAISALLSRESLGTAAIEGELLDPGQVRSSIARIGNSSGLRLLAAFYRDHPQFAGAASQVEVRKAGVCC